LLLRLVFGFLDHFLFRFFDLVLTLIAIIVLFKVGGIVIFFDSLLCIGVNPLSFEISTALLFSHFLSIGHSFIHILLGRIIVLLVASIARLGTRPISLALIPSRHFLII
jgi:hypothetical protein